MDGIEVGVNESVVAEQTDAENIETSEVAETETEVETTEESTTEEETSVQSAEDNAKYAAARRQAEEEYRQKTDKQNETVKRLFGNYKNPETGKPIETVEEYFEAIQIQQRNQQEAELRKKGVNPKLVEQMIANNPAIREAQEVIAKSRMDEAKRTLDADLKAIQKIDTSIKSLEDLAKQDNYGTIVDYVRNNHLSLVDAYKLVNSDKITEKKSEAVKQAAINSAKSTSHLDKTKGVSTGDKALADIPSGALSKWRDAYPNLSDAELKAKYNAVQ